MSDAADRTLLDKGWDTAPRPPERGARRLAAANPLARLAGVLLSPAPEHRSARQAVGVFALRGVSAGIAYASQVLLARWMGGPEYGVFVSVWSWLLILSMTASLGLTITVQRFVQDARSAGDDDLLRGTLLGTRVIALALSTTLMAVGIGLVWLMQDRIADSYVVPAILVLVCLPMMALVDVDDGIARTYDWMFLAMAPPFVWRPLVLLVCVAAMALSGGAATATAAAAAAIIAVWSTCLVQLVVLQRRLRREVRPGARRYRFREWVRVSLPVVFSEGFAFLLLNADVLALSLLRPAEEVAIYFAATRTISLVLFIAFAVAAALGHRFAEAYAKRDTPLLRALLTRSVAWTLFPSLAAAAGMLAVGPWALLLFGPAFTVGYAPMCVLAIGFVVRASVGSAERLLNMAGEERACALVYASALGVNVALNVALIPPYGLMGAAAATVVALLVESAGLARLIRRRLGVSVATGWNPMAIMRPVEAPLGDSPLARASGA